MAIVKQFNHYLYTYDWYFIQYIQIGEQHKIYTKIYPHRFDTVGAFLSLKFYQIQVAVSAAFIGEIKFHDKVVIIL